MNKSKSEVLRINVEPSEKSSTKDQREWTMKPTARSAGSSV